MNETRETIQGLFDYCGDIKKNGNVSRSAQYSPNYSPNNIKTVVISTEGVLIRLHKAYVGALPKGAGKVSNSVYYLKFNPMGLYRQDKDGKIDLSMSVYKMLVKPLVCASIEEIFILTGISNNALGQFSQYLGFETNQEDLVSGFRNGVRKDKNTHDLICERFPRLHGIYQVNLNFLTFMQGFRERFADFEKSYFIADCPHIKNYICSSDMFNEKWYEAAKLQTTTYSLDIYLSGLFEKIKSKYQADDKQAKIDEFKKEVYKRDLKELETAIDRYVGVCKIPLKLRAIVKSGESNGVVPNIEYPVFNFDKIIAYNEMPKGIPSMFIDSSTRLSMKETIQRNKEITRDISKIVTFTSTALIDALYQVHLESPLTLTIMAKKIDSFVNNHTINIIVPSSCQSKIDEMKKELGSLQFRIEMNRLTASIANSAWIYSLCFIDNNANTNKYNELLTWANLLKKGEK